MKLFNLSQFVKGWFIGNFTPTIIPSEEVEIAIKRYKKGNHENSHYHAKSDEVTVIISGIVKMNDKIYSVNDIIWIEKNEVTDFTAVTDVVTCVVKIPCVKNDKYEQ